MADTVQKTRLCDSCNKEIPYKNYARHRRTCLKTTDQSLTIPPKSNLYSILINNCEGAWGVSYSATIQLKLVNNVNLLAQNKYSNYIVPFGNFEKLNTDEFRHKIHKLQPQFSHFVPTYHKFKTVFHIKLEREQVTNMWLDNTLIFGDAIGALSKQIQNDFIDNKIHLFNWNVFSYEDIHPDVWKELGLSYDDSLLYHYLWLPSAFTEGVDLQDEAEIPYVFKRLK